MKYFFELNTDDVNIKAIFFAAHFSLFLFILLLRAAEKCKTYWSDAETSRHRDTEELKSRGW